MSSVPLCQHLKTNGKSCGAPALKHRRFCYFHDESRKRRRASAKRAKAFITRYNCLNLPILEDANAVQVGLMETIDALIDARITERQAGLIIYALQTASANLKRTSFETDAPKPPEPWAAELITLLRGLPKDEDKPDAATTCHPEQSAASSRGAEGPFVSPASAGFAVAPPDAPASAQTALVGTGDLACPGEQSSPASSFAPSAPSALISPSDGTMARSPDRPIPRIHAAAVQKDELVIPSGAATGLSASQSTRSRRSRGTCISPAHIGTSFPSAPSALISPSDGTMARSPDGTIP